MAASLTNVMIQGFDSNNPGDPVASANMTGLVFQAGETALWDFISAVGLLVASAQNVDKVVTTKHETVTTIV